MNYKLEKFWNEIGSFLIPALLLWTINLKSFEIAKQFKVGDTAGVWTINLKSFEIHYANTDKATIH